MGGRRRRTQHASDFGRSAIILAMPSVQWNADTWGELHTWDRDGDEWSGMAEHCGQPYGEWKESLVETFVLPYLGSDVDVLEIAPGHGRWTQTIVSVARSVTLVDLNPACIQACRDRFQGLSNVAYYVNDGRSIPTVPDSSVDFVWSFDSFVHMEPDVVDAYLGEFARVLRPGGRFVIHHADKRHWSLSMIPVTGRLALPGRVVQLLAGQGRLKDGGNRSDMSARLFAQLVTHHGLSLERQTDHWGGEGRFTVTKYRDIISIGLKP
jgi:SAM-dependent methyltransferase